MSVQSAPAAEAPHVLAGRYQLLELLGRGSGAAVYSGLDRRIERPVTIKLFEPAVARDVALRARFQRQAARAARLVHPHIAALLDAGFAHDADGSERPFVVTEPAGARSLRALLRERRKLSPARAVKLARQVASALAYAHRRGTIHADLKPENVIVDARGSNARLVDFSLSFVSSQTGAISRATIARRAAYLAPEQVRGEALGPATDVYGLGVLLYEMLVGRPPFVSDTPERTAELRVREAARPASVFDPYLPPEIEPVLGRALERRPEARWRSMEELDTALERIDLTSARARIDDESPDAEPVGALNMAKRLPGRRGAVAGVIPLAAILLAMGLAVTFMAPAIKSVPRLSAIFSGAAVPSVIGMDIQEGRRVAESRGLDFIVIGERVTEKTPRGQIVQQAPIAGWESSDQPIRVTVSSGVEVPDVRGRSEANAARELSERGWRVARTEMASHPGHASGTVVLQHPAPGQVATEPGEMLLAVAE